MEKKHTILVLCLAFSLSLFSQTILTATGSDDSYALINSVLAPGYNAIEVPDCVHTDFGDHIDEVYDNDLKAYAFRFYAHVDIDNDRCKNFDRQRTEIKTYDQSPDNLLGTEGETVVYKWKFKLDAGFQPSSDFTHLHQIKAVGGDEEGTPKITLTARKKTPDDLELRYSELKSQVTVLKVDLDPFKGNWVEVEETITYGEEADGGAYEIVIKDINSGETLLSYSDDSIRMWNTDAEFMRPKWGIYRKLDNAEDLRDEEVLFADFSIEEVNNTASVSEVNSLKTVEYYQDYSTNELVFSDRVVNNNDNFLVYNLAGQLMFNVELTLNRFSLSSLKPGLYVVKLSDEKDVSKSLKIIID